MWRRALIWTSLAMLTASACATQRDTVAEVKSLEAESAARLVAEGGRLFESDSPKRNGYDYCSIAADLVERGELRRGIREASKALFLGQRTRDLCLQGNARRDLASAYSFAGHLERARAFAEEAVQDGRRCPEPSKVLLPAYKVIGDVHLRQGRPKDAIVEYEKILASGNQAAASYARVALANAYRANGDSVKAVVLLREGERNQQDPVLLALVRRGLGQVALAEGQHREAAQLFEGAAAAATGDDAAYHRLWALTGLARARRAAGDRDGSLEAYQRAIRTSEEVRARFRSEEFKTGFFGDVQDIFDGAIETFIEAGQGEAGFTVSERSRARALQDLIRGRVSAKAGAEAFAAPVDETVTGSEVRASLPDGAAIVEYHVTPRRTYAWVVRKTGLTTVAIDAGRDRLVRETRQFRQAIAAQAPSSSDRGRVLHDLLVRPLALQEGEPVIIVPHDVLHYLPFQAIPSQRGYLIEAHAVSYVPSSSVAVYLWRKRPGGHDQLLAFGNPDLGPSELGLPGAEREVLNLRELFPAAEVYLGKEATKERWLARAPQRELVHVAAHAEVDEVDPMYSFIRLASNDTSSGNLEAHEVYAMDLRRTGLVTLSACDTALGQVSRGDELWGFTRSFLAAGTRSVLVSLWPVEDESTASLMQSFYRNLPKASAQQALQAAQVQLLRQSASRHPFFWAAFNLIGDSR